MTGWTEVRLRVDIPGFCAKDEVTSTRGRGPSPGSEGRRSRVAWKGPAEALKVHSWLPRGLEGTVGEAVTF